MRSTIRQGGRLAVVALGSLLVPPNLPAGRRDHRRVSATAVTDLARREGSTRPANEAHPALQFEHTRRDANGRHPDSDFATAII
jgi:hypothetical protein